MLLQVFSEVTKLTLVLEEDGGGTTNPWVEQRKRSRTEGILIFIF